MKRICIFCMTVMLCLMLGGCRSEAVRDVEEWIDAMSGVEQPSVSAIEKVRAEYQALSPEDRAMVENAQILFQAEADQVDALIGRIGEVTENSGPAIAEAEAALQKLEPEAAVLVTGVQTLEEARTAYETEVLRLSMAGIWVNEVVGSENPEESKIGKGLIRSSGLRETDCNPSAEKTVLDGEGNEAAITGREFELRQDGTVLQKSMELGTWRLSEDHSALLLQIRFANGEEAEYSLKILEEDGFTKLVGGVFGSKPFGYVRNTDYTAAFQEKYALAELNPDNLYNYLGDPVALGKMLNAEGVEVNAFVYPSHAYDDGLVYLGSSCTFRVDYTHGGMPRYFWAESPLMAYRVEKVKNLKLNTQARINGELFYIKAEYVVKNEVNAEGFRVLELTNGVTVVYDGYEDTWDTFWNRVDADYSDYIY